VLYAAKTDLMMEAGLLTKCPECGKEIPGSGYEFGEEIRTACYQCSCGARVYVDRTPKETYEKLGIKQGRQVRRRHRRRFHCTVCNEVIVRKRSEEDELSALKRHYSEAHKDLPVPHKIIFAECDLTKMEKEGLRKLNEMVAQIESVMPEVLKEMKEKGFEVPDENKKRPKTHVRLGSF
jgi:hypothetical protein